MKKNLVETIDKIKTERGKTELFKKSKHELVYDVFEATDDVDDLIESNEIFIERDDRYE